METLTRRELEVLGLICGGYSTKATAAKLKIAFGTVSSYRTTLHRKAGVHNAVGLLRWAITNGYVKTKPSGQRNLARSAANSGNS
jgi:DNA-binding CsgD family transcriptional regulator